MVQTEQCRLLVVRSSEHAARACRDVSNFLTLHPDQNLPGKQSSACPIIGLWVESAMIDLPVESFGAKLDSDGCEIRFRESMGINGLWSLWWLDVRRAAEIAGTRTLRESLLEALTCHRREPRPRFAPVFNAADPTAMASAESSRLRQQFAGFVMPPMFCDSKKGALYPESEVRCRNG
jgi:hypothetical protein